MGAARFIVQQAACLALLLSGGLAQTEKPPQMGGASTGAAHAPVKDAQSRPITAGGFVDVAPIVFSNITHVAGLDDF